MITKSIDLHVHSNKSDGTYSPTELVDYAIEKGLAAIALTDHDTVDGLDEIMEYAKILRCRQTSSEVTSDKIEMSEHAPISKIAPADIDIIPEIIPGIEFSTEYEGRDVHILGLYIDHKSKEFEKPLQEFVNSRILRNEKMCKLLQGAGIDITYKKLCEEFPDSVITRAHYGSYLLKHGYIKSMNEAFEKYVGDHCPYFVPREKVTPQAAVQLILKAKGVPILAHPPLYHMSDSRLDKLIAILKDAGLMGIEAIYSTYSSSEERDMRRLAEKYDLLISGGSDFHGKNKPKLDLGTGYGKLYVDYSVLEAIKASSKSFTGGKH